MTVHQTIYPYNALDCGTSMSAVKCLKGNPNPPAEPVLCANGVSCLNYNYVFDTSIVSLETCAAYCWNENHPYFTYTDYGNGYAYSYCMCATDNCAQTEHNYGNNIYRAPNVSILLQYYELLNNLSCMNLGDVSSSPSILRYLSDEYKLYGDFTSHDVL